MKYLAALVLMVIFGISLHTRPITAANSPIVLVHGYGQTSASMKPLADRFTAAGYTVYNLNLPGVQGSGSCQYICNDAKYICDYINQRSLTNVTVIGHSMGGMSSLYCALKFDTAHRITAWGGLDSYLYNNPEWTVCLPFVYGGQMCPSSAFVASLKALPNRTDLFMFEGRLNPGQERATCRWDIPGTYNLTAHQALPGRDDVFNWFRARTEARAC